MKSIYGLVQAHTLEAASARDLSLQAIMTCAPRATSASLVASPTPALPPVTMQICKLQNSCLHMLKMAR